MRKSAFYVVAAIAMTVISMSAWAQGVRVSGRITSTASGENVSAVSVTVKNSTAGATTDASGRFELTVPSLPVTLVFSSVGYETQEVTVNSSVPINVNFAPTAIIGQEVVVSASRTPQRLLEAPVSIERVSAITIRNSPSANYYDIVTNLKGVDAVASSLTLRTLSKISRNCCEPATGRPTSAVALAVLCASMSGRPACLALR